MRTFLRLLWPKFFFAKSFLAVKASGLPGPGPDTENVLWPGTVDSVLWPGTVDSVEWPH